MKDELKVLVKSDLSSAKAFNYDKGKILSSGKGIIKRQIMKPMTQSVHRITFPVLYHVTMQG